MSSETHVLFCFRKLSSCIEALQSTLLPFSWQHTYIPVLPVHLLEMCEAPTPYVIGLPKTKNVDHSLGNIVFESVSNNKVKVVAKIMLIKNVSWKQIGK